MAARIETPGTTIQEADAYYLDVLADLQAACFAQAWGAQAFGKLLALPGHRAWMVVRDGKPLGYALFQIVDQEAELLSIGVLPDAQGQGLGRQLLRKTLHICSNLSICKIVLDVATDNDAAIGLYKDAGFKQVGFRKNYYHKEDGKKTDALVMVLEDMF